MGLAAYEDHEAEVTVLRWKGGGKRKLFLPPTGLKWVFPETETTSDSSLYPVHHDLESFLCVFTQKNLHNIMIFSFNLKILSSD